MNIYIYYSWGYSMLLFHIMVNNEHYILLKLLCAAVTYDGQ